MPTVHVGLILAMPAALRRLLALIGPGRTGRWVLVVVLALLASGMEILGALLVFGLLARITSDVSGFEVPLLGDVREVLPALSEVELLLLLGGLVAAYFVIRGLVIVVQAYVQYRVAENAGARLASRLLEGYLAMPASFHLQRNSAELIRNTFDTVQIVVREGLLPLVKLLSHTIMLAGLLVVLLVATPGAALMAVVLLGPVIWLVLRLVHPRVKQLGRTSQQMAKTTMQTLREGLGGWRDITVLGRQRAFVSRFDADRRRLARVRYLRSTAKELPRVVTETSLVLFILAFLGLSVVVGDGALEALPTLGLFGYVGMRMQPSINEALHAANALKFSAVAVEQLHDDLELFTADRELPAPVEAPRHLREELRLDGVAARYPGADEYALVDVDLTIRAGEFLGIVGPTGAGKSTLVDLLLGLLPPTEGRILLDGHDLHDDVAAWHASIGVVHQTVFLTDASVRRNVALGIPEDEIDEEAVLEAIRLAQLEDFVAALPEGLDTLIGEDGVRVSGGQRQRLAIARSVYRRPSTVFFDEGTSALDSATEAQLMAALEDLRGQRTIVAIAHRLSTVERCDRVVLIESGRIVDVAPFDELVARHAELLNVG